ncbi:glycosyltransferase family 92 protein RCOM_0530710-like [Primulina tabacum]|uniref:glycosyltransferase family 92 protein RCOM_0530710-like n=1 Tax=Primulina tabacum TaxID=48773 RepID=UPI003F59A9F2
MDSPDQRRKRKRFFSRQSYTSFSVPVCFLSVRFSILCLSFLTFLYLLSNMVPSDSSAFRPVLVVSGLSLLSSSSSRNTAKSAQDFRSFLFPLKIENRVLFPDHISLLLSGGERDLLKEKSVADELECVYYSKNVVQRYRKGSFGGKNKVVLTKQKVLSVDVYEEFRLVVRCPLPSVDYSAVVNLMSRYKIEILGERNEFWVKNQTVNSWENVVYAATVDGDSAVVFVKGLNLRPDRESHSSQFSCHFRLGKWERNEMFTITTKALSAAQEVLRCSLPISLKGNHDKAQGVRVTVGVTPRLHGGAYERVLMPSVANIFISGLVSKKRIKGKYELCVCTMVWNQASTIREWILYHAWLGVERWFIYDNDSDDRTDEVIRELDQENYNLTRHVWPWIKTQEAGFSHCALTAKDECRWVSFMDVDEYFYLPFTSPGHRRFRTVGHATQNSLRNLVANISSSSKTVAEIRTSCHSFGPSGLNSPPPKGVMVGYTCRLQSPERHKSIVRPDALHITLLNVVHHFHLKKGFKYLNLPQSTVVINHYKYQVWEVFRTKFHRRVATYVADWQQNQNEGSRDRVPGLGTEAIEPPNWAKKFCEVWDTGLRDFVMATMADLWSGLLPWETHSL